MKRIVALCCILCLSVALPVAAQITWEAGVKGGVGMGKMTGDVEFSQTVGAIQALRAKGTPHKVVVLPDETHYFLKFDNLIKASHAIDDWFDQMLIRRQATSSTGG